MTEMPEFVRRAIEAQGKVAPEEVEQRMGELDAPADDHLPGYDAERAAAARDEAIARVERAADPEARDAAYRVVARLATSRSEFTTDQVQAELDLIGVSFDEPRALGPVMRRAQDAGLIARTDRTVLSVRESNHRRPIRVWESRVAGAEQMSLGVSVPPADAP